MNIKIVAIIILFTVGANLLAQQFPYENQCSQPEDRAEDLLNRLTLTEKVGLMMYQSPAIPRLNIPAYNWWNECLHGVARAGTATVFPQAIGLAAMFNSQAVYGIGDIISTEARAKHHAFVRAGRRDMYQGLTFWTPNVNIFRDPRWGRGQETYGEDPFLTGCTGVAFVKGLQGNDDRYLKTIATAKHFAVHSGPEPLRHSFDAQVSDIDLFNTYLPAFEKLVKEANVESVMCAYNRVNGEPCCGNKRLIKDILREDWGFDGYVVSDCWAIDDFFGGHNYVPSATEASAMAVIAGTDLECGNTYKALINAVEEGLIDEKKIDISVKRLLIARIKLGMFDPEYSYQYGQIPLSVVNSVEHQEMALDAARQSMVLLKNENKTLPLKKDLKKILVCGPNADEKFVLLGNYNGVPLNIITPLEAIQKKVSPQTQVSFIKAIDHVNTSNFDHLPTETISWKGNPGFYVEYFQNDSMRGLPVLSRMEKEINFFQDGGEIAPAVLNKNVSFSSTSIFKVPESGLYQFSLIGDEGARLYLDDQLFIDSWIKSTKQPIVKGIKLKKNQEVLLRFEYFQHEWNGEASLKVLMPYRSEMDDLLAQAENSDVVIMVGGITPRLEGEEMGIDIEGFKGGDRTSINLPIVQQNLLKKLQATNKPVVLILLNGSALALNWEDKNIPAIVEAWYGGESGGQAVADILFGDYNPAGRLPVTFYSSEKDLPDYQDYSMKGRTYRYFEGEALYSFGHGLSYSEFKYGNVRAVSSDVAGNDSVMVEVEVENISSFAGDEVIQVYLKGTGGVEGEPIKQLVGFVRQYFEAKENKVVKVPVCTKDFRVYNLDKNSYEVVSGEKILLIGASSSDIRKELKIFVN